MAQVHKIGRRKTSTARVYVQPGKGTITVNKREFETYFPLAADQNTVMLPLRLAELEGQYDVKVNVSGGGVSGQAGAIQLGIARVVDEMFPDKHTLLKSHNLFTRDDRMVERKKYGQPKARKKFQFSKR
jgi:small subunit ribosomal protein S9